MIAGIGNGLADRGRRIERNAVGVCAGKSTSGAGAGNAAICIELIVDDRNADAVVHGKRELPRARSTAIVVVDVQPSVIRVKIDVAADFERIARPDIKLKRRTIAGGILCRVVR